MHFHIHIYSACETWKEIDIERFSGATYFILCACGSFGLARACHALAQTHSHTFTYTVRSVGDKRVSHANIRSHFLRCTKFYSFGFIYFSAFPVCAMCNVYSVQCVHCSIVFFFSLHPSSPLRFYFILWILDINTYFAYLFGSFLSWTFYGRGC